MSKVRSQFNKIDIVRFQYMIVKHVQYLTTT